MVKILFNPIFTSFLKDLDGPLKKRLIIKAGVFGKQARLA
jgi:hypothetical protein